MQGLILAAGMGNRLGKHTESNTKCMVKINDKTLIEYTLDALSAIELERVIIVTGYEGRKLQDFIGNNYKGMTIVYVNNEVYNKTNNIYSLWLARDLFQEDDTILLESDVIFEEVILKELVKNPNPNVAVVDKFESWMDGTVTIIDDNDKITSLIPKKNFSWQDISNYYKTVNIYKFSRGFIKNCYLPFLNSYIEVFGNNEYYEQALRVLTYLDNIDFKAHKLKGEKWYEVDDIQDLDIAEVLFSKNDSKLHLYQKRFGGYWRFPKLKDFCYLVNPYFPTSAMNEELKSQFNTLISEYPSGLNIQNLLGAKMFECEPSEVLVGNGAAELIKGLFVALEGDVGIIYPTFNEYPERIGEHRVKRFIPKNKDFTYTIEELKEFSEGLGALVLINPDNPSGHFFKKEEVLELVEYLGERDIRFIFDESFIDFANRDEVYTLLISKYLQRYKNLIVIKSISKSYGVPGIRLGVLASSDKELVSRVRKEVSIWNINSFGEHFLQIISKYKKDYKKACDLINNERNRFFNELSKISFLRVLPSRANYFLCEVKFGYTATKLAEELLNKHNILIKDCTGKIAFENGEYIRIAVRNEEDNNFLLEKLKEIH